MLEELCPGCTYRPAAPDGGLCVECAQQRGLRARPRPAEPKRRRPAPLPTPQRWALVFAGGRLDKKVKGDEAGERIGGVVDDAERIAKRGPVALLQAAMGGKGFATSVRGSEGSSKGSASDHSDPTEAAAGARDREGEITAALHLAVEGARLLHVARAAIDRLVPDHPEDVVTPIGSRAVTASACMVCEDVGGRIVRGMCESCRSEWVDAGHPDVALWIAARRSADTADNVDELAAKRERRRQSREAAVNRLVS